MVAANYPQTDPAEVMREVRDRLLGLIDAHEATDHAGQPCLSERVNMVAYLAHCLGLGDRHLGALAEKLRGYSALCQDQSCGHAGGQAQ